MTAPRADFLSARPDPDPDQDRGWDLCLRDPVEIVQARRLDEVLPGLERIDRACRDGLWAAVALCYEAAPAFDPVLNVLEPHPDGLPLLWAALFDKPCPRPEPTRGPYRHTPWTPLVGRREYDKAVARIRELIGQGETYQANYTLPFECSFEGDARAWHADLSRAQQAGYAAFLDTGRFQVLSLSPELFFRRDGNVIAARPMKGTLARGNGSGPDSLAACPKNRAENVMITDLTRNDLGRIARPGTVRVDALCAVEAYPTLWQMVSEVRAELAPGARLPDVLAALFPCGSITGAPKIRTMDILRGLEPHPRGLYCGAIGLVKPGGDCVFNVPIRTLVLDRETGRARFGVGGGITWDSTAKDEYEECLAKMRFLSAEAPFEMLETLLLDRGRLAYEREHLARMAASAGRLGFPWPETEVRAALDSVRSTPERSRVRLLLDRDGQVRAEVHALPKRGRSVRRVGWAAEPVDSADPLLAHKTTQRELYDRALASRPDCDDVLLHNERGQATESCLANLVVRLDGKLWTPDHQCGLLAGVFRQRLLARGVVRERVLTRADVERAERVWLVNSVRRWMDVRLADPAHDTPR